MRSLSRSKNDQDIVNTLSSSSLSYTFTWVISRMCIEVPNLVIYNSNLRHRYMAIRLLWLLSNKGLLRLHILFLFYNWEMWTWNRFGLLVVLLFLFFRNSLRILWKAYCKTAKVLFLVLKLWSRPMHGSRHSTLWSRKLSQRSNMTQRLFRTGCIARYG